MAGGYAAPEAAEDYPRCVELSERSRSAREVLPCLLRSWSYYAFRGNLREADRVSEAAGRKALEAGLLVHAQQMGDGAIAFFRGDFERARREMEAFTANTWAAALGDRPPPDWPLPHDPLTAAWGVGQGWELALQLGLVQYLRGERPDAPASEWSDESAPDMAEAAAACTKAWNAVLEAAGGTPPKM